MRAIVLHIAIVLATGFSALAYESGDPSGLQYLALYVGALIAVIGLGIAVAARLSQKLPYAAPMIALLVAAVLLGLLPHYTFAFEMSMRQVDRLGLALAGVLVLAQVGVGALQLRAGLRPARPQTSDDAGV